MTDAIARLEPASFTAARSRHPIALPDLDRAVVDGGEHAGRVAGNDDVEHGRAGALGEAGGEGGGQLFRVFDADAVAPHGAGDPGVIHLDQVGGLITAAEHRVLQRLHITRGGVVDDDDGQSDPGAARGFEFAQGHVKAAVAADRDDRGAGCGERRPIPPGNP